MRFGIRRRISSRFGFLFFGALLLGLLLLFCVLRLGFFDAIVSERDFPEDDREDNGVHEDHNKVQLEKSHGQGSLLNVPLISALAGEAKFEH